MVPRRLKTLFVEAEAEAEEVTVLVLTPKRCLIPPRVACARLTGSNISFLMGSVRCTGDPLLGGRTVRWERAFETKLTVGINSKISNRAPTCGNAYLMILLI